jgi:DNA primase
MLNHQAFRARRDSALSGVDIVELIGQTVELKRAGKDFVGLCPFHEERTPSFHVSPAKRFFHCFGCKAHGNAIDFVMKRDRIDFVEALRVLGGGWSIAPRPAPPARTEPRAAQPGDKPNVRFDLLAAAHARSVNPARLDRLAEQLGLSSQSLRRLNIGWAGERWCRKCEQPRTAWSFPMSDVAGHTHGVRLRFVECGHKSAVTGGHEGLFIPRDLDWSGRIFICEGPTDTAALLDLGLAAIGRPSCTGGVPLTAELLKGQRVGELVIFADHDRPGQSGAAALAGRARLFCPIVRIVTPPEGVKDARQWKQRGATAADVQGLVDAAPAFRLVIKSKTSTSREGIMS